jgi:hypothetical protein
MDYLLNLKLKARKIVYCVRWLHQLRIYTMLMDGLFITEIRSLLRLNVRRSSRAENGNH